MCHHYTYEAQTTGLQPLECTTHTHISLCTYTQKSAHTRAVCCLMELLSSLMSVVVAPLSAVPLITSLSSFSPSSYLSLLFFFYLSFIPPSVLYFLSSAILPFILSGTMSYIFAVFFFHSFHFSFFAFPGFLCLIHPWLPPFFSSFPSFFLLTPFLNGTSGRRSRYHWVQSSITVHSLTKVSFMFWSSCYYHSLRRTSQTRLSPRRTE